MKSLKWAVAFVISLTAIAIVTARTHTSEFVDANGDRINNAIAEQRFMSINNDRQYVLLRGRDRTAPILLYLHGGPGFTGMPFMRYHNAELENHFLVAHWDQRAAGKSFKSGIKPASLTLQQYISDLDSLIDQLKSEFSQEKLILMGHSWGSMLGLEYIKQHPQKVSAYFGIGQAGSQPVSEAENYTWTKTQAKAQSDLESIAILDLIGPPPYADANEITQQRVIANKYGAGWMSPKSTMDYVKALTRVDEFSWFDLINVVRSETFSMQPLFEVFSEFDAQQDYSKLEVPVVLFTGRHDHIISALESQRYYNVLSAPYKEFILFEQSAHNPHSEEPEKFNQAVIEQARKLNIIFN